MFQQFGGDGHFRFHSFVYVGITDCIRYIVCLDSLADIYLQSQIDKILDELSIQIDDNSVQISGNVKKLLEIMDYDIPYTSNKLMEKLGLKSKDGFRRNYLHPAMELNLVQMTIPDKPRSRNQRYVKV